MAKVACQMCGEKPAVHQWSACANGNRYVAVCLNCDWRINELLLAMLGIPQRFKLMAAYRRRKVENLPTEGD